MRNLISSPPACFLSLLLLSTPVLADYVRIEENDPSVTYTGNWQAYTGDRLSGGRLVAGVQGSTATVTFNGTGIVWIEYFSSEVRGGANIYLDGVQLDTVAARESGVIDVYGEKQVRYALTGLADTTHVLTIEGTGARFGFPPNIALDAFYVERNGETRLIEESDSSIAYTGEWVEFDDPSVSGGSVLASQEPGATATVRFNAEQISWISYACPCAAGIARVSVPDFSGTWENHNAYSTEIHPQATIFSGGGIATSTDERQLTIEVTGDSVAESPWVVIDAFRIPTGSSDGPDTTPPEVRIMTPRNGAVVGGRIQLYSDFFDNSRTGSVSYLLDGAEIYTYVTQPVTMLTGRTWWETIDTSPDDGITMPTTPDGPHVLTAVARDAAGNETRASIDIVVDNVLPTVTLTAPAPGASVTGIVTLSAATTGTITNGVRFWARAADGNDYFLGSDDSAPYSITRDTSTVPSGRSFELWADTFSVGGTPVQSPSHSVTVQH